MSSPIRVPDAWISYESIARLSRGGNESKGTVPIHAERSAVSCIGVYFSSPDEQDALASLRHLYKNLMNGGVKDSASAKRIATGLLGPAIEKLGG